MWCAHRVRVPFLLSVLLLAAAPSVPSRSRENAPALRWFEQLLAQRDPGSGLLVVLEDAEVVVLEPGPILIERASGPLLRARGPAILPGERVVLGAGEAHVLSLSDDGDLVLDAPLQGEPGDRLLRVERVLEVFGDPEGLLPLPSPLRAGADGRIGFYVAHDRFELVVRSGDRTLLVTHVEFAPADRGASQRPLSTDRPERQRRGGEALGDPPAAAEELEASGDASGGGGTGVAPDNASYVTRVREPGLTNELALADLPTGLLKNEGGSGSLSVAAAGVDYYAPGGPPVVESDIDAAVTRDAEWDSAAKINAATSDADFLVLDAGTQALPATKSIQAGAGASLHLDKSASAGPADRILSLSVAGQERTFVDADGRLHAFDGVTTGIVPLAGSPTTWTGPQTFESTVALRGPAYLDPDTDSNALTLPQGPRLFFEVPELTAGGGPSETGFAIDTCRAAGYDPGVWDNAIGLFYNASCGMGRTREDEWAWGSYWETNWSPEPGGRWFEWNQDFVSRAGSVWRPWYFVFDTNAHGGEGGLAVWAVKTRRGGDNVLEILDDASPGARGGVLSVNRPPDEGGAGALSAFRVTEGPVVPAGGAAIHGKLRLNHDAPGPVPSGFDGVLGEVEFDSAAPATSGGVLAAGRFRAAFGGTADDREVGTLDGLQSQVVVEAAGTGNRVGSARGVLVETGLDEGVAVGIWQGVKVADLPAVSPSVIERAAGISIGDLRGIGSISSDALRVEPQSGGDGRKGNIVLRGGNATNGHLAFYNGWVHVWAQQGADPPVLMVNRDLSVPPIDETDGHAIAVVAAPVARPVVARCGTVSIAPPSIGAGEAAVGTAPVPGLAEGDVCACVARAQFADPIIPKGCRGLDGNLRLRLYNASTEPLDPGPQDVDYCCWAK